MDQIVSETLQLQEPEPSAVGEGQEEPMPMKLESGNSHDDEGWKLVTSHTRKKVYAQLDNLHFQKRFTGLAFDEKPLWWVSLSHSGSLEGSGE